jgi:hypothetical protein
MFYLRRSKMIDLSPEYKCLIPRDLEDIRLLKSGWEL